MIVEFALVDENTYAEETTHSSASNTEKGGSLATPTSHILSVHTHDNQDNKEEEDRAMHVEVVGLTDKNDPQNY